MNSTFEIVESSLKINSFTINFEYNISDVIYWDGIYAVLLAIPNEIEETDNIYGIDSKGKVIWRIENSVKRFEADKNEQVYSYLVSSTYVHIHLNSRDIFIANNFLQ